MIDIAQPAVEILTGETPTPSAWAGTAVLPDGDRKGQTYDPQLHPPQAAIWAACDAGASHITIVKPVQDGGSLIAFLLMLHRVCALGQTAIMAYPTLTAARDAWTKKLAPILGAIDMLPKRGGGSSGGASSIFQIPGGGSIIIRSAGGRHESGQASATGDVLIPDEVDDWPDMRRVKLIEQRITKSQDPLVVFISTVKRDGEGKDASHILRMYEEGTQTRLEYPCPHCGKFQTLEWERVNQETAQIACEGCGVLMSDGERLAMLPHWRRVDKTKSGQFSIMWTALDSPFPIVINGKKRPILQGLCDEWRYAETQAALGDHSFARQFYRDRLCRPYRADLNLDDDGHTSIPTRNRLAALSTRSPYALDVDRSEQDGDSVHLSHIPDWCEHTTVAVDVQRGGDRAPGRLYFEAISRGNGKGAITGYGSVTASPQGRQPTRAELHAALDRLDGILRDWNPAAAIVARGVDVGDRQDELLPWIQAHRDWRAIKGTGPLKATEPGDRPGWLYLRQQAGGWALRLIETRGALRVVHGELLTEALLLPRGLNRESSIIRHLCASVEFMPDRWSEKPRDRVHHPEWQARDDLGQCAAYARALAYEWESRQGHHGPRRKYGAIKPI